MFQLEKKIAFTIFSMAFTGLVIPSMVAGVLFGLEDPVQPTTPSMEETKFIGVDPLDIFNNLPLTGKAVQIIKIATRIDAAEDSERILPIVVDRELYVRHQLDKLMEQLKALEAGLEEPLSHFGLQFRAFNESLIPI
jgi:hypothetical protein